MSSLVSLRLRVMLVRLGFDPTAIREDHIHVSPRSNPGNDAGRGQQSQLDLPSLDSRMMECRC
jgi:hypothetical protein